MVGREGLEPSTHAPNAYVILQFKAFASLIFFSLLYQLSYLPKLLPGVGLEPTTTELTAQIDKIAVRNFHKIRCLILRALSTELPWHIKFLIGECFESSRNRTKK